MPIVKGTTAIRLTGEAIVLDLGDLEQQAVRLRSDAERQAQELLAAAREEADVLVGNADARGYADGLRRGTEEGRAQGMEAGRREALEAGRQQLDELVGQWRTALERWDADRTAMLDGAREELLDLALRVARRIVFRVAQQDSSVAADQVAAAIDLAGQSQIVAIRVHPDDEAAVRDVLPALIEQVQSATGVELVIDAAVGPGGAIVRTKHGEIDARIETQIDRIVRELLPDGAP